MTEEEPVPSEGLSISSHLAKLGCWAGTREAPLWGWGGCVEKRGALKCTWLGEIPCVRFICDSHPRPHLGGQIMYLTCLLNFVSWMFHRHLKLNGLPKPSAVHTQPALPLSSLIFPGGVNGYAGCPMGSGSSWVLPPCSLESALLSPFPLHSPWLRLLLIFSPFLQHFIMWALPFVKLQPSLIYSMVSHLCH